MRNEHCGHHRTMTTTNYHPRAARVSPNLWSDCVWRVEVNCASTTVAMIESWKFNPNLSTIVFALPSGDASYKEIIDSLGDLLRCSPSIHSLEIAASGREFCIEARAYLLRILATGSTGENLSSLWFAPLWSHTLRDRDETDFIEQFLRRNKKLKQLIVRLEGGPGAVQLASAIATSSVSQLWLGISSKTRSIRQLGAALGQCSSISEVKIDLLRPFPVGDEVDDLESFFQDGVAKMPCLKRFEIHLGFFDSARIIRAISRLVAQRKGTLEHFKIDTQTTPCAGDEHHWLGLGTALSYVKSVSIHLVSQETLLVLLPRLQSCESLVLALFYRINDFRSIGSILSQLSKLRTVEYRGITQAKSLQDEFLEMIKSSDSVTNARFRSVGMTPAFQKEVDSFCILNKVFGSRFAPNLWTHILAKMPADVPSSARATLLYCWLRTRPELVVDRSLSTSMKRKRGDEEYSV